jgi:multiple antibiotic resistance protein
VRELCIGLGVLVGFLFTSQYILAVLAISQPALRTAGGIILFLISIKMIFSGAETIFASTIEGEPFIVPLAIPLVAGPSSMTTVMLLMAQEPTRWRTWFAALVCAWVVGVVILVCSTFLSRILGERGLTAIERLMGMLLTTVAVEMFIDGMQQAFFH